MIRNLGKDSETDSAAFLNSLDDLSRIENMPVVDPESPNAGVLHHIFSEIYSACRAIHQPTAVSYLGPEATFTHMAALRHFGHAAQFKSEPSIRDIFNQTVKDAGRYGIVPVENSIEGSVNQTLDLLLEYNLKICAEVYHPVCHCLLSRESDLESIHTVYSHPQALAQCREWLRRRLPAARMENCASTADAACRASKKKGAAAVAAGEVAPLYQLNILVSGIEDIVGNITRFLVMGRKKTERTGCDKTSLLFATSHKPGALYRALAPLAEAQINMVKLESRPAKRQNWSYCFFTDLEGHIEDAAVAHAVEKMKEHCMFLKCLGSYPKATGLRTQG